MTVPVALVIYNRPQHTRQVIDSLRPHEPQDVIVFCDGVKGNGDRDSVNAARAEVDKINWTKPSVVVRSKNAGLAHSIVAAVDTTLGVHDSLILLEDDCVVGPYFFTFMHACLKRYKDNKGVLGVTGYTVPVPQQLRQSYKYDAYFVPRPGSWGWATWADRWQWYERDFAAGLAAARRDGVDLNAGGKDTAPLVQMAIDGKHDSWTPGWMLATARRGVFAYPTVSHVVNVGFDGTGVHCSKSTRYDTPMATDEPTRYPDTPSVDAAMLANFRRYYG